MSPRLVETSPNTQEYEATWRLRAAVLLDPFGIDHHLARADDAAAFHLGLFVEETCLACLLLVPRAKETIQMRQVAVVTEQQRRGLGRQLVTAAEKFARDAGFAQVIAHARDTALPFYLALDYQPRGEPFVQVGLPHRTVEKKLSTDKSA